MDRRLIADYFRRYWMSLVPIVFGYAAFSSYQIIAEDYSALIAFCIITVAVCAWHFVLDSYQLSAVKTIRTLPVSERRYSQTLWGMAVLIPVLAGCSVFLLVVGSLCVVDPEEAGIVAEFPAFLSVSFLLTGGFLVFLSIFRIGEVKPVLSFIYGLLFVGYCVLSLYLLKYWYESDVSKALTVFAAAALAYSSYRFSPRFLRSMSGRREIQEKAAEPARTVVDSDLSVHWRDGLLANPLVYVMVGTLSLLGLVGLTCLGFRFFGESPGLTLPVVFIVLFFLLIEYGFIRTSISFLGSIRVFVSLPISRRRLILSCLILPFVALSPIAASTLFFGRIGLLIYFVAVGGWLAANTAFFRWDLKAAVVTVNSVLVVLGLWPFTQRSLTVSEKPEYAALVNSIGIGFVAAMILVGLLGTWWLLQHSNSPFRKKPGLWKPY